MSTRGSITLAEPVGKLDMLEIRCHRCERHGRVALARLIDEHGADTGLLSSPGYLRSATLSPRVPRGTPMRFINRIGFWSLMLLIININVASFAQQTTEEKAQTIKEMLVVLCLAGGSETVMSAKGDLELRSKIKDVLSGNLGGAAAGQATFSKKTWEGIIGGISKEMTVVQSQQANDARKCMVDNGFSLVSQFLASH